MSDDIKQHVSGLAAVGREVQGIGSGTREYWVVFWRRHSSYSWKFYEYCVKESNAELICKGALDGMQTRIVRVELPV